MPEKNNEFYSRSPITGEKFGPFRSMSKKEVDEIISLANGARASWAAEPLHERLLYIKKMIKIIADDLEKYSDIIHIDNGKSPIESLISEFLPTLDIMKYYLKNANKILGKRKARTPFYLIGKSSYVIYEPLGTVGIISPWNYPFALAFVPAMSALIAGNTIVLKHSSITPRVGSIMEEITSKAGLPKGVFNIVWGKGVTGQYVAEGNIQKLFFTGSTEVGRRLAGICAEKLIPVELELGGNDPCIVLEGANIKRAAKAILWGCLINTGQTCVSLERIYVTEKDYDSLIDHLKKGLKKDKVGKGEDADIGYMTNLDQIETIRKQLSDAVKKGAKILAGGSVKGNLMEPVLVAPCDHTMGIMNDETFGPVIAVVKTKSDEESLEFANRSNYGLSSSVFGPKKKAREFSRKIQAGSVNVNNTILSFIIPDLPLGGIKDSGIGRYHSSEGLYTFCNIKSILDEKLTFMNDDMGWMPYGRGAYRKYLRFIKSYWGTKNPLRALSALPLLFKKK